MGRVPGVALVMVASATFCATGVESDDDEGDDATDRCGPIPPEMPPISESLMLQW